MQNGIEYTNDVQTIKNEDLSTTQEEDKSAVTLENDSLCSVGKLWIVALRAILLGAKMCLIPSVKAAPPPKVPDRPKLMKSSDLPLYDSPHYDYKDHKADKLRCKNIDQKIVQTILYPHVSEYRKEVQKTIWFAKKELADAYKDVTTDFRTAEKRMLNYMRDSKNDSLRKACMTIGMATGFYLGSGGGLPRRVFATAVGTCAAGSVCYPKETDEGFRTLMYYVGKGLVAFYNSFCGKSFAFRERIACARDMPTIPPPTKQLDCKKK